MEEDIPNMPQAFQAFGRLLQEVLRVREELRDERLWWRGQPTAGLPLKPKAFRNTEFLISEYNNIHEYNRQAPIRYPSWPTLRSHQLVLMQHYGLPTRLLDWTQGFLIACYFAVSQDIPDQPASLWALNPYALNNIQKPEGSNPLSGIFPEVSSEIQFMVDLAFTPHNDRAYRGDRVLAMSAPELDLRMLVQWSVFTIHSSDKAMEELPDSPKFLREIKIPAQDRCSLRQAVKILGCCRSRLFPDLESLADDVSRLDSR